MVINLIFKKIILFLISIIISSVISFYQKWPNVDQLTMEGAKIVNELNVSFLLFWAVLFFTCITGIIGLIPLLRKIHKSSYIRNILFERSLITLLYFILLSGAIISVTQSWNIYRVNYQITFSGKLGEGIKEFRQTNPSLLDSFLDIKWEFVVITLILFFLGLLYLSEISFNS